MASRDEQRDRARRAVRAVMSQRGWNPTDLAKAAGIDMGTAGDFLSGARWPRQKNQGKIETALEWKAGTIAEIEAGADPPGSVPAPEQGGVLLSLPPEVLEGLSPTEREEVVAAARLTALQKAREIRGSQ